MAACICFVFFVFFYPPSPRSPYRRRKREGVSQGSRLELRKLSHAIVSLGMFQTLLIPITATATATITVTSANHFPSRRGEEVISPRPRCAAPRTRRVQQHGSHPGKLRTLRIKTQKIFTPRFHDLISASCATVRFESF